LVETDELVWRGDCVQVGLFSVVEVSVRLPDAFQHGDAERQGLFAALERQPPVHPRLSEVAVHRVRLQTHKNRTRRRSNTFLHCIGGRKTKLNCF